MKFTPSPIKRIMFGYGAGGIGAEYYKQTVGHYHSGVDYSNGYGTPVITENYGIVYKINTPDQSDSGWQGVYVLVPDVKYGWVEECFGHLSRVDVKVGQVVREGQQIGLEGNKGEVYSGGKLITKAMQMAGSKAGSHTHYQIRPVKPVVKPKATKHYLNGLSKHGYTDKNGRYRDGRGLYWEIQKTNDTNGCVDPFEFIGQKGSLAKKDVDMMLDALGIH
jgi:murein DD-endopeptidase MepM/ murein hydrolase activator NlpD